jgi:hypothetical protein
LLKKPKKEKMAATLPPSENLPVFNSSVFPNKSGTSENLNVTTLTAVDSVSAPYYNLTGVVPYSNPTSSQIGWINAGYENTAVCPSSGSTFYSTGYLPIFNAVCTVTGLMKLVNLTIDSITINNFVANLYMNGGMDPVPNSKEIIYNTPIELPNELSTFTIPLSFIYSNTADNLVDVSYQYYLDYIGGANSDDIQVILQFNTLRIA